MKKKPIKLAPRSVCAVSNVLDRLGDKWSLLIIRDIIFHQKHEYKEFLSSPEKIATNILSDKLSRLCQSGFLAEIRHPSNKSRKFYYLSEQGKDLLPLLVEIVLWADKHLPYSPVMEPLARALKEDRNAFIEKLISDTEAWEQTYLSNLHKVPS